MKFHKILSFLSFFAASTTRRSTDTQLTFALNWEKILPKLPNPSMPGLQREWIFGIATAATFRQRALMTATMKSSPCRNSASRLDEVRIFVTSVTRDISEFFSPAPDVLPVCFENSVVNSLFVPLTPPLSDVPFTTTHPPPSPPPPILHCCPPPHSFDRATPPFMCLPYLELRYANESTTILSAATWARLWIFTISHVSAFFSFIFLWRRGEIKVV